MHYTDIAHSTCELVTDQTTKSVNLITNEPWSEIKVFTLILTQTYTPIIYIVDLFRLLLKKYLINRQNEENLYVNIVILKSY